VRGPRVAALLAAALASCVSMSWRRDVADREPRAAAAAQLVPGESDLARILDELGAPNFVEEKDEGLVLTYGWLSGTRLRFSLSVPVSREVRGSLRYGELARRTSALVLFLDADDRLERVERGYLGELRPHLARRRPAVTEPAE